jgi:hypothetical protein
MEVSTLLETSRSLSVISRCNSRITSACAKQRDEDYPNSNTLWLCMSSKITSGMPYYNDMACQMDNV